MNFRNKHGANWNICRPKLIDQKFHGLKQETWTTNILILDMGGKTSGLLSDISIFFLKWVEIGVAKKHPILSCV